MEGLRETASLLQDHGHPEARRYPLPMLWKEAEIVRRRLNRDYATTAVLTQLAVAGLLSEKAGGAFREQIKKLTEE